MNKDDIKVLTLLYNMCNNSVVNYVLSSSIYFKNTNEEKEGLLNLNSLKEKLAFISRDIEDLCIKNKLTLTLGTYKEEYTELNYLSYEFIKNYVLKELKSDKDMLEKMVENININNEVKEIVKKFINDIN